MKEELLNLNKTKENISNLDEFKNVNEVFSMSPELVLIGSKEDYLKYIENIFPQSVVKNIVWHGGNLGIDEFSDDFANKKLNREKYGLGFYTTENSDYAKKMGEKLYGVMINSINPMVIKINDLEDYKKVAEISKEKIDEYKTLGFDSLHGVASESEDEKLKMTFPDEYVAFHPEQIHILGSKKDIENFKQWKQIK